MKRVRGEDEPVTPGRASRLRLKRPHEYNAPAQASTLRVCESAPAAILTLLLHQILGLQRLEVGAVRGVVRVMAGARVVQEIEILRLPIRIRV